MGRAGGNPPAGESRKSQRETAADHSGRAAGAGPQTGRAESSPVETAHRAALQSARVYAAGCGGIYSIAFGKSRHAQPDGVLRGANGGDTSARTGHAAPH